MGGKKLDARNWNVRFDFFANASFWGERGSFNCCERRNEDEDSMEMLERLFLSVSRFLLLLIFLFLFILHFFFIKGYKL